MCAGCGEGAVSDRTCQKFRAGDFLLDDAPWLSVWLWWWLGVDWPGCSHRGTPVIMPRLLCSCLGGGHPTFCGQEAPLGLHPPSGAGSSVAFPGLWAQSSAFCVRSCRNVSGLLRVLVCQHGHIPGHTCECAHTRAFTSFLHSCFHL